MKEMYIESPGFKKCLIRLPETELTDMGSNLVIGLHGGGSKPEDLINLFEEVESRDFFFTVPEGLYPFNLNNELVFDWGMWPTMIIGVIEKAGKVTERYILRVMKKLQDRDRLKKRV